MDLNEDLVPPNHLSTGPLPWDAPPPPTQTRDLLPIEILIKIFSLLGRTHLAICARVSREFYNVAAQRLYRVLTVNLDANSNPLVIDRAPRGLLSRLVESIGHLSLKKGTTLLSASSGSNTSISSPSPSLSVNPIPYRFSFIVHLTIHPHAEQICSHLPPVDLPNLESLRIFPSWTQTPRSPCKWHHPFSGGHCETCRRCHPCPLTSHLNPRTLILSGDLTGLDLEDTGTGSWNRALPPPRSVSEVVVHVGVDRAMELRSTDWVLWVEEASKSVEKVTVILQPRTDDWFGTGGNPRMRKQNSVSVSAESTFDPSSFWRPLGMALAGEAREYRVVGLEMIDREWSHLSLEHEIEAIRTAVRDALVKKGWKAVDAEKRAGDVDFMVRAVYDKAERRGA